MTMLAALAAAGLAISAVSASPYPISATSVPAPLAGFGVEPINWTIRSPTGGPAIHLTGTVEEVVAQLSHANIDLDEYFNSTLKRVYDVYDALTKQQEIPVEGGGGDEASLQSKRDVTCTGLSSARRISIQNSIIYIRTLGSEPVEGPSPNHCSRMSCSNDSALWWCNGNAEPDLPESPTDVATSAQLLVNFCLKDSRAVLGSAEGERDSWRWFVKSEKC